MNAPTRPVYLDNQATAAVDFRVLDAMLPFFTEQYGNPHSRTHNYGKETERAVEIARSQIAELVNTSAPDIVFTSGATESNNIAIKGVARFYRAKKKHVVTVATEHKCVLDSCRWLETEGFDVTYLPVQQNGLIDLNLLEDTLKKRPDTSLVSVMAVNNEIGVIQPLKEIGGLCRQHGAFFHTDAAQALGKIPLDVEALNIDLMSMSSHKIYGPKGCGALYVRRRPRVRVEAQMSGGGQERGLRSGTLPAPLIVGFGAACSIAKREMAADEAWIGHLSKRLLEKIRAACPAVVLNGDADARYVGNLNISFPYVEGESLLLGLKNLALSSGSACTSQSLEPSYVLRALGVEEDMAHTSIRFGIGRFTSEREIDHAAEQVIEQYLRLRELSPLWEMVQEGIDLKSIQWTQEH